MHAKVRVFYGDRGFIYLRNSNNMLENLAIIFSGIVGRFLIFFSITMGIGLALILCLYIVNCLFFS